MIPYNDGKHDADERQRQRQRPSGTVGKNVDWQMRHKHFDQEIDDEQWKFNRDQHLLWTIVSYEGP